MSLVFVIRPILFTAFALVAFALNSILCRMALGTAEADAAGFTGVRLLAGALTLMAISKISSGTANFKGGSWASAFCLFGYAICFSLAYLSLTAGTGALILFGSVQLTMMIFAVGRGERPRPLEWLGLVVALGGLIYLVYPGLAAPPITASLLMVLAGAAWAFYTLRGRGKDNPLADTTGNFVRSLPTTAVALLIFLPNLQMTQRGIVLAIVSGAVTSGIGYALWYSALKYLTATRAAVLQLLVPLIAAAGGIFLLNERLSLHLTIAGSVIIGGVILVIAGRRTSQRLTARS